MIAVLLIKNVLCYLQNIKYFPGCHCRQTRISEYRIIEVLVVFWVCFSLSYLLYLNCRKDVRLPVQLQRAMAAEAEAAREARAKVIAAEGEMKASRALKEAADVIAESPAALQVNALCLFSTGSPL